MGDNIVEQEHEEIKVITPRFDFIPMLNPVQISALENAMNNSLTIIQGPPSTGKTLTSAYIVYNLYNHYKKPVLVVAPSNDAVGELARKIFLTGLKVCH